MFDNVGVSVTATVVSTDPYPYVMVGCRRRPDAETGYRLSIRTGSGEFLIDRIDRTTSVDLVEWQQSAAVRTGTDPNRLELRCAGPTITALVNDTEVASVEDATYAQGLVWFGTGASEGSTVDTRFANFTVTQR